ncbi:MAG: 2-oxoacid:ferredoxin oxidoreductase subunit gamma [Phycisphaerae bacterium]|nr:2-oxoacid:ferredoxin oxidoreductase subunit gamma [Phycisphaerae bacterium]NIR65629.1 2-oxoacid:ferredoxin oxidoreductase subunit gamma [candidate division Zixibacteria bacterium]NIP51130.1 2-oxoacid:ferredoxin oxidoreductase subunit gamma [Phycisphaerae bacterium]NIS51496.1 2-oxoacid:ferredoxin oxidoreductase subunit gamma [Phycisphaerae bacterium]NIU09087.1 2-oxoacid:ferredoxin oxidoreductase subunit gamma [Phycisphaerae bacterium]
MQNTKQDSYEAIIIAGFGGQGIILAGRLVAQTAMKAGKEVTYMPSYGAEVRGGTANCTVIISDEPIASPLVNRPDSLIIMNKASLNKFVSRLKNGGLLIMNSSLIDTKPELDDSIEIIAVPADEIAVELGNKKAANMVALGAYFQKRGILSPDAAVACLPDTIARRYHKTLPVNTEAIHRGAEFTKDNK